MTIAYWCLLAAALLPYVWALLGKSRVRGFDNRDPRGSVAREPDPRVHRAMAAQSNAFEAFAPFAAGVLMAQAAGVDPGRVSALALAFVACRALHGVFYVADLDKLRSLIWAGGIACVVGLMALAALQVA